MQKTNHHEHHNCFAYVYIFFMSTIQCSIVLICAQKPHTHVYTIDNFLWRQESPPFCWNLSFLTPGRCTPAPPLHCNTHHIALAGPHQGTVGHWLRTTLLVPAPLFCAPVRCVLCQTPPFICSAHHDWPRPESPPFSQPCAHCNGRYNFMLNPCIPCLPGVATHFTASLRDIMVSLCVLLCGAVFPPVVRILENTEWPNLPRNVPRNFFQKLKKWFQMV